MTDQEILTLLHHTGHIAHPFGQEGATAWDSTFPLEHPDIEKAIHSYQDFHSDCLDRFCLDHHSRPAHADGDVGPATRELFALPRCGHPDYGPKIAAATGSGNWKGCHGIGDFHSALIHVDYTDMPEFLKLHWEEVWERAVASFAEIGLSLLRTEDKSRANITVSFETRRQNWIGLAIVGSGQSCSDTIWAQFHAGYHPQKIVSMWTQLLMHEFGHNCGWQHTRGGVMSATLMVELPPTWKGDPIYPLAKRMYGGVPVPGTTPPDVPPVAGEEFMAGILTRQSDGRKADCSIRWRAEV